MRSPDKNRFLNAVKHIESEEVPFQEIDPEITHINRILGKEFPLSLHSYTLPPADNVELNIRMGNDMVYFGSPWRLGRVDTTTEETGERTKYVGGTMKTRDSLKDITYSDLGDVERKLEETVKAIEGTGLGLIGSVPSADGMTCTAMGPEDYWMNLLLDPEFVHEFDRLIFDHCRKMTELFGAYGVDVLKTGGLMGATRGLMCSREVLEEFHLPLLRDHAKVAKDNGMVVMFHVDGNIQSLIPDFIDMGVDILHPVEPCSGAQDIYDIKKQYGDKITLWGNIDVGGVLAHGTPEEVRRDTVEHMDRLAVGGGYIVGSSHDLAPEIPLENFYAMRDAVHQYRFENQPRCAASGRLGSAEA